MKYQEKILQNSNKKLTEKTQLGFRKRIEFDLTLSFVGISDAEDRWSKALSLIFNLEPISGYKNKVLVKGGVTTER